MVLRNDLVGMEQRCDGLIEILNLRVRVVKRVVKMSGTV